MSDVKIERHGAVLELQLDRPSKKNAVSGQMYGVMTEALAQAAKDDALRAVVFSSSGETFCAGNDVADFMRGPDGALPALRFVEAIAAFPKPMVAAVHGAAVGIGATMLLHCDLVYASDAARLHTPFVTLGLVPEAASSLLLPRRVGQAVAAEMILLGRPLPALRAFELGLVNEIVGRAALREHALTRAAELARQPPSALRVSRLLLRGDGQEIAARIAEEAKHFLTCLTSAEARDAFLAFVQKRTG